jgi:hypothetical protein
MLFNISEFRTDTHAIGHQLKKRDSVFNFGGVDKSQVIKGNNNHIMATTENPSAEGQETLLRKTAHQIGRIFEGGADLATAPAQWLKSIQQNWYEYYE